MHVWNAIHAPALDAPWTDELLVALALSTPLDGRVQTIHPGDEDHTAGQEQAVRRGGINLAEPEPEYDWARYCIREG